MPGFCNEKAADVETLCNRRSFLIGRLLVPPDRRFLLEVPAGIPRIPATAVQGGAAWGKGGGDAPDPD